MNVKSIELAQILQDTPDADHYLFSYRPDLKELMESIVKNGLLCPPVLKPLHSGYQIICGFQRIKALSFLKREKVTAFILPEDQRTELACLRRNILENKWHRGFNEVEKALLFVGMKNRFSHLIPQVADLFQGDIKWPQGPKALDTYHFLLTLQKPVRDGLAQGEISLGQALLLKPFPSNTQNVLFELMRGLKLTFQQSRRTIEWIDEICKRDGLGIEALLNSPPFSALKNTAAPSRQDTQEMLNWLEKKRYPHQTSWKARMEDRRRQAGIEGKGIQLFHDPTFETTELTIQIKARTETEVMQQVETLAKAGREGRLKLLFQALQVEQVSA